MTLYLPRCKVSKESIVFTPNWIMGKTMATTECRSVTGAIKELTTIQTKKTKNYNTEHRWNNELTAARKHETQRRVELRAHARQHRTKATASSLRSSYYDTRHRWGSQYKQVEGYVGVGWVCGGGAGVLGHSFPLQKILESLFFEHTRSFFIDTNAHNQLQVKKRDEER